VEGDGAVPMLALELDAPALILADGMALSCATKAMAGPAVPIPLATPAEAAAIIWRYRHRAVTQ
ncbi:MAG: hypothetical protein ACK4TB_15295, partial [Gemmobacter sp.]